MSINGTKRIYPYIPLALHTRLKRYVGAQNTTESAVVEAAITAYLDGAGDADLLFKRLDRMSRAMARMERANQVLLEMMGAHIKMWFAYTPPTSEDEREAAQAQAERRFNQFLDFVAGQLSGGSPLIDELVQDQVADDEELSGLTGKESANGHE